MSWAFGSYSYPKCHILSRPRALAAKLRIAPTPGRDGEYSQGGLVGARRLVVSGVLIAASGDDIDTLWDAFVAAHAPGAAQALYPDRSDRYLRAEVEMIQETQGGETYMGAVPWEVAFVCVNPFYYAATATAPVLTTGGGTFTVGGSAPALGAFTLNVSAIGSGGSITVTNSTTGKAFTITPTATGNIIIDCDAETVTRAGVDVTAEFSGLFFALSVGSNTIAITTAGGATLSAASLSYRNRWY
jgi:phage-related protein